MGSLDRACPFFVSSEQSGSSSGLGLPMSERIVCFDQHGFLLSGEHTSGLTTALLSTTLAQRALETDQPSTEIVNAGGSVGQIYRYGLAVPSPTGKGYVGVVVISESIQMQENALSLLLLLVLSGGGCHCLVQFWAGFSWPFGHRPQRDWPGPISSALSLTHRTSCARLSHCCGLMPRSCCAVAKGWPEKMRRC